jgi:hypothetical protein
MNRSLSGITSSEREPSVTQVKIPLVAADPECFSAIAHEASTDSFTEARKFPFGRYEGKCNDVKTERPFRFLSPEVAARVGITVKPGFRYVSNFKHSEKSFGIAEVPTSADGRDLEVAIFYVPLSGQPHNHYGLVITNKTIDKPLVRIFQQLSVTSGQAFEQQKGDPVIVNRVFLDVIPNFPVAYIEGNKPRDTADGSLAALRRAMDEQSFIRIYKQLANGVDRLNDRSLPVAKRPPRSQRDLEAIQSFKKLTLNLSSAEIMAALHSFLDEGDKENLNVGYRTLAGLNCSAAVARTLSTVSGDKNGSPSFQFILNAANPNCQSTAIAAKFFGFAKWKTGFVPLIETPLEQDSEGSAE